ncbi:MAG TPA: OB-fold domain-containing protein [Solirubrobacteraceae bacterium]|jgi:hypothetical protein|nr:OB-fold domain-containing protein [Solirubrobacteraceae bacterium]
MGIIEGFREGLERGELLLQSCNSCGKPNLYPRHHCPFCQSADLGWTPASGEGVLHSWTVVRAVPPTGFEEDLPYALGVIKLAEGPQLTGRLRPTGEDRNYDAYDCDVKVRFDPAPAEEVKQRPIPWFAIA